MLCQINKKPLDGSNWQIKLKQTKFEIMKNLAKDSDEFKINSTDKTIKD